MKQNLIPCLERFIIMFLKSRLKTSHECLTIRLTEPPIFLFSISSPFMQSLNIKIGACSEISWHKPLVLLHASKPQHTCNPVIAQQVLWQMWRMRSQSLSRSPALSSPAGCKQNTVRCSYKRWWAQKVNRYESKCILVLAVRGLHLTLDKDQTAGSWGMTAKQHGEVC